MQYYYNGKCEFLIVNLLKISILSKDDNFTLVKDILNCIILDDYEFDISIFIQCFYEVFVNNNFEEAEIYMDTVSMADSMGEKCVFVSGMRRSLRLGDERRRGK